MHRFALQIMDIKFTAPKIDDTPARWGEKLAKSRNAPACAILELNYFHKHRKCMCINKPKCIKLGK